MTGLLRLLFPPKCTLCRRVLEKSETDLCRACRETAPEFTGSRFSIPFVTRWTALWHYEGTVRQSLLLYKFHHTPSLAPAYGRLLAMKLVQEFGSDFDILTWIPISRQRKRRRGYDQVKLLADAVGKELAIPPLLTLKKIRNNPPQSGIIGHAQRKANVLGIYKALDPQAISGKRILLLDDIVTTGATASECARVLLTAGAKEVSCAAIAAAIHQRKNNR